MKQETHHHSKVVEPDPAVFVSIGSLEDDLRIIVGDIAVIEIREELLDDLRRSEGASSR